MPKISEKARGNLGGYIGTSTLKMDEFTDNGRSIAVGLNAGVIYELDTHGELEFGMRYEKATFGVSVADVNVGKLQEYDFRLKHFGFTVGYNHKF